MQNKANVKVDNIMHATDAHVPIRESTHTPARIAQNKPNLSAIDGSLNTCNAKLYPVTSRQRSQEKQTQSCPGPRSRFSPITDKGPLAHISPRPKNAKRTQFQSGQSGHNAKPAVPHTPGPSPRDQLKKQTQSMPIHDAPGLALSDQRESKDLSCNYWEEMQNKPNPANMKTSQTRCSKTLTICAPNPTKSETNPIAPIACRNFPLQGSHSMGYNVCGLGLHANRRLVAKRLQIE